ncbi:hypothetical protein PoB_007308100 [Plakobranchus ocellatus]|uniref:Uncharacterized protein n=1 Tax=Plakobranchus ocellatus TaxID=259542 RepID=A0AAV4DRV1_9GAST|nr:hypothetical protein PoB_007308100 [Plakobranchus ocellatus]
MISWKSRRHGAAGGSSADGLSRTIPRPSDIARNLATPSHSATSSSTSNSSGAQRYQTASSSSGYHKPNPLALGGTSYGLSRSNPVRAVANPYDDLSLYTSQINAVHKPDIRPSDQHQGYRVSATSGGYFGFNKPTVYETPRHYGFNKTPTTKEFDGRYQNAKANSSDDTRGHYGFNKLSGIESSHLGYYGYNKPSSNNTRGHYGYNKSSSADSQSSNRYGFERAHARAEPRDRQTPNTELNMTEPSLIGQYPVSNDASYSQTLPWSGRFGKQSQAREQGQEFVNPFKTRAPLKLNRHNQHELESKNLYSAHAQYPFPEPSVDLPMQHRTEPGHNAAVMSPISPPESSQPSSLRQFLTSTPKSRREINQQPLLFEDHNPTSSTPSFPLAPSSSIDYTSTLPSKFPSQERTMIPSNLHVQCDLVNRFGLEEKADQQRSQSMSPHVYRGSRTAPLYPGGDAFIRETKTPPASSTPAMEFPLGNLPADELYDRPQFDPKTGRYKYKKAHDSRNQSSFPAPPKQSGLAATLNYHQQLRKELGMPQSNSPVPGPSSSASSPFKYPSFHLSDSNIPFTTAASASGTFSLPDANLSEGDSRSKRCYNPTLDKEVDLLTALAFDGNARRYQDAFQNLHGHCSTPHLPSATSPTQTIFDEPPLFGSDPNLLSKSRQPSFNNFYDNIFFGPSTQIKSSHKHMINTTFPPANSTSRAEMYPYDAETRAILAQQHGSIPAHARPSKSSSSLPTSTSAFTTFLGSQEPEFKDWKFGCTSPLTPPCTSSSSSSSTSFPFPVSQESYYSSTSVQGFCTLPRNNHNSFQNTTPVTPFSLAQKEPSYEEITNIVPASRKETGLKPAALTQTNPDISSHHLDAPKNRQFAAPDAHTFAPSMSSANFSDSFASQSNAGLSDTNCSSGVKLFNEDLHSGAHHSESDRINGTYPGLLPGVSAAKVAMTDSDQSRPQRPDGGADKTTVGDSRQASQDKSVRTNNARSGSIKFRAKSGTAIPGSVSERANKFEQNAALQAEKKKSGIPSFNFVRLRNKNIKSEKKEESARDKQTVRENKENLNNSFEKVKVSSENYANKDKKGGRNSIDLGKPQSNLKSGKCEKIVTTAGKNLHGDNPSALPVSSQNSLFSSSSSTMSRIPTAAIATKSSIPLRTFSSSSSSSPPRQRLSNPEDAGSKEAAYLAVTGSDVTVVTPARGQQTSSMHETRTGSVDVEAFNDFLLASGCPSNYYLFSRRKKPLPGKGDNRDRKRE